MSISEVLYRIADDLTAVEAWVKDSVDPALILEVQPRLEEVLEHVKILLGSCDAGLRKAIATSPGQVIFMGDRTLSLADGAPKRKLNVRGRQEIRDRLARRALAASAGEVGVAITVAIELTEKIWTSPSDTPKWGELKALGFDSWSQVADEEEGRGKVTVTEGGR